MDEGPSDEDLERFSGETVFCPHCRGEIHDEAQRCPLCGEWITAAAPENRRWLWRLIWMGAAIGLMLVFLMP